MIRRRGAEGSIYIHERGAKAPSNSQTKSDRFTPPQYNFKIMYCLRKINPANKLLKYLDYKIGRI